MKDRKKITITIKEEDLINDLQIMPANLFGMKEIIADALIAAITFRERFPDSFSLN